MYYSNKNLYELIEKLKECFGNRLKSVFVYGAKSTDEAAKDNIDLMIIVGDLSAKDLAYVSKFTKRWVDKKNPVPVFMSESEWFSSADVYPMEYADIKENHRILYGENLIADIVVRKEDLRLQCEQESKNILMRYRKFYILRPLRISLLKSFVPAIKDIIAVLKAILRLKEIAVPKNAYEIIKLAKDSDVPGVELFRELIDYKNGKTRIKEVDKTAENLLNAMNELLKYTNDM